MVSFPVNGDSEFGVVARVEAGSVVVIETALEIERCWQCESERTGATEIAGAVAGERLEGLEDDLVCFV